MENNLEEQLEKNIIRIKPSGYSMYPVIIPGRDYVYIDKADFDSLKKGDVVGKINVIEDNQTIMTIDAITKTNINKLNIFTAYYRELLDILKGSL